MRPVIESMFLGNALKTTEFNKGYMGAINSPTRGKANPINEYHLKY
jgi:hypothetical protein